MALRYRRLIEVGGFHDAPCSMGGTYSVIVMETKLPVHNSHRALFFAWRRENAARVWQAMQAVLAVVGAMDAGYDFWAGEVICKAAGWYK